MNALLSLYVYVKSMFEVEEGQDLIEYALIIGLVVLVAVAGLSLMGGSVETIMTSIQEGLAEAASN